jgi:hypothetical protein
MLLINEVGKRYALVIKKRNECVYIASLMIYYKVVQIWPGLFVCKQVTVCPGHIWTTLYKDSLKSCRIFV